MGLCLLSPEPHCFVPHEREWGREDITFFLNLPQLPKASFILWFLALSLPLDSSESDGQDFGATCKLASFLLLVM